MRGFGLVDRPPSHEKDAQGVTKDDCIALKEMEVSVHRKQQVRFMPRVKERGNWAENGEEQAEMERSRQSRYEKARMLGCTETGDMGGCPSVGNG